MTAEQVRANWREIEESTAAGEFLMKWAAANGPLDDLSTSHPAIRVVMHARRHLLERAHRLRKEVLQ